MTTATTTTATKTFVPAVNWNNDHYASLESCMREQMESRLQYLVGREDDSSLRVLYDVGRCIMHACKVPAGDLEIRTHETVIDGQPLEYREVELRDTTNYPELMIAVRVIESLPEVRETLQKLSAATTN